MGTPQRWFIGTTTTGYLPDSGCEDRPELADEVERMASLFTGRLGYRRVPGFDGNLAVDDYRRRLRAFLTNPNRSEDDLVVVYYTGHGVLDEGELFLPMANTTDDVTFTSLPATELTERLLRGGVRVGHLLVLLDTCYSGAATSGLAEGAVHHLNRLQHLDTSPSVGVVVAARPMEQATSGEFTRAFVDAVGHHSTGGHEPQFLPLDEVVHVVNATTPEWQHARTFLVSDTITRFLPNPRWDHYLRGLDLRTQALQRVQEAREVDRRDHVLPRAQGLDTADPGTDDLWLFEGRHAALERACTWLKAPHGPAILVVTGDPGSGKSALLARLAVLADKKLRNRVEGLHALPSAGLPPIGSITRFVHARGLSVEELMAGLCEACGVDETTSPGELLASLSERTDSLVVVVDAIDEAGGTLTDRAAGTVASGRFPAVGRVLAPLVRAAGRTRLRLLLGTRRHLVPELGEPVSLLDLDTEMYADPASVRRYVRSCLVRLSPDSVYRHQPAAYLDAVAEAVAGASGSSFLVALITARRLALTPHRVDPYDHAWRDSLPRMASDAMRDDLDLRLGPDADRARDLLLPLAYARGTGLPWEDVWPRLAQALTGRPCSNDDLDWLIDHAGYYIVESSTDEGRRSVYRLFHESLAEHLRATREDPVADETAIVDVLVDRTERLPDGDPDWEHARPYVRTHLATHAATTPRLDDLVDDPHFLLAATPAHLLDALSSTTRPSAQASADAYRRATSRLRRCPPHERPAYLQLAARCARAPHLADRINASGLPIAWGTAWASWRLQPPHTSFTGHTGPVNAVAVGQVAGRTVIVSGGRDATVWVWDPTTGQPVGDLAPARNRIVGPPSLIDFAASVSAMAMDGHSRMAIGTELGVVWLRLGS